MTPDPALRWECSRSNCLSCILQSTNHAEFRAHRKVQVREFRLTSVATGAVRTVACALVASRAEFAVRLQLGQSRELARRSPSGVQQFGILRHAGEIPVRLIFVVRLVVLLGCVILAIASPRAAPPLTRSLPRREADRRDADLGEGEVVGAVEAAGFRMRIGRVVAALLLPFGNQHVEQVELGWCREMVKFLAGPSTPMHVRVEHADGLAERVERVGGVIFASRAGPSPRP